jgi:quinohemoprotein ethanol dehydrogenase
VWQVPQPTRSNGGALATAGNLVFEGLNSGDFVAYAADTGKQLWSYPVQNGVLSNPITYTLDGKQYVTLLTGWRASFEGKPDWDYRLQKRRVLTFVLDGKVTLPPLQLVDRPIVDDPGMQIDAVLAKHGAFLFNTSCMICHGVAMRSGGAAPDLRKSGVPLSADAFAGVVRDGGSKRSGMPAFEEYTREDLEGLRMYIRQRARADLAAKGDAARQF